MSDFLYSKHQVTEIGKKASTKNYANIVLLSHASSINSSPNSVKAGLYPVSSVLNSNVNWSGSELHWIPIYTVVYIYLLHVRYIIFCSSVDFYFFV